MTDLSLAGLRLSGVDLPAVGTELSVSILAPSTTIPAVGHVRWVDRDRRMAGIELDWPRDAEAFSAAMLSLATEIERPAVVLVVDDPRLAARLCDPLRHHGMVPLAFRAPLQLLSFLDQHANVRLALVHGQAMGIPETEWTSVLTDHHPSIACVEIGDTDTDQFARALAALLDRSFPKPREAKPSKRPRGRRTVTSKAKIA